MRYAFEQIQKSAESGVIGESVQEISRQRVNDERAGQPQEQALCSGRVAPSSATVASRQPNGATRADIVSRISRSRGAPGSMKNRCRRAPSFDAGPVPRRSRFIGDDNAPRLWTDVRHRFERASVASAAGRWLHDHRALDASRRPRLLIRGEPAHPAGRISRSGPLVNSAS